MIKLTRIKIVGFKRESKIVEVVFSQNNVSIIFGENGSGKTTFLLLLSGILSQDDKRLEKENVSEITIDYIDDGNPQTVAIKREVVIQEMIMQDENKNEKIIKVRKSEGYNWKQFENSGLAELKSMFFGVQRGVQTQYYNIDEDDILRFFRSPRELEMLSSGGIRTNNESLYQLSHHLADFLNFRNRRIRELNFKQKTIDLEKKHLILENINIENIEAQIVERYITAKMITGQRIQNALFDTFSLAIDDKLNKTEEIPDNFSILLEENAERLIESLESSSDNHFTKRLIDILKGKRFDTLDESNSLLKNLIYRMIKEIEQEEYFLNSINKLINVFNEHLGFKKKLFIEKNKILVSVDDSSHSINELSSGERHLLTFLALVLIDGSSRDFLIIDEPEISLNAKWQRTLLGLLADIAPNTQIIVASHSPTIAKYDTTSLIEITTIK